MIMSVNIAGMTIQAMFLRKICKKLFLADAQGFRKSG